MPDATDELIAERRLHAAVDDGNLTNDDVILASLMRNLLDASEPSITIKPGWSPIIEFPGVIIMVAPEEFAAIDRYYSDDRRGPAHLTHANEDGLRGEWVES